MTMFKGMMKYWGAFNVVIWVGVAIATFMSGKEISSFKAGCWALLIAYLCFSLTIRDFADAAKLEQDDLNWDDDDE